MEKKHIDLLSSRLIEKHSLFTDSQLTQKKSGNGSPSYRLREVSPIMNIPSYMKYDYDLDDLN